MRLSAFAVIVASCSLFACLLAQPLSPERKQDKASTHASNGEKSQQQTTPYRVTLEGPVTVVNQPDANQHQRDAEQQAQTKFENWVNGVTLFFVALAAGGAVGAYFANKRSADAAESQVPLLTQQVRTAEAEAVEQRRIANETLAETRKATSAAQTNADAAVEALGLAHRAWIFHETFEAWLVNEAGHRVGRVIVPVFKNSGTAPAVNLRSNVIQMLYVAAEGQGTFPSGHLPHPTPDTQWESLPEHVTTLGPGSVFRADPIKLTFAGCEALEKGTKALIIHGILEYSVRPGGSRRRSTYCCRVTVTADYTSAEKPFTFPTGPADHSGAD